jgi:membrane peptidoglycan carboxypeptidase
MWRNFWSTSHRWLVIGIAGVVLIVIVFLVGAWIASPAPTQLDARVGARLSGVNGRAVPLSAIAPIMRDAVVATEDERFYRHHGIDIVGVIRALPYDVAHLSLAQGASTITEQLAKVLYLHGNDHTPWRKLEDAAAALKLESRYSKEQILAAYLNSAYLGDGTYGIWAASERYFGVAPRHLGRAQATLLAGLIQAPSAYDPLTHPSASRARQVDVLRSLVRNGFMTEEEAGSTLAQPLRLRAGPVLAPVRGVDLSPGPAFIWWQLASGAAIAAFGAIGIVASRLSRFHGMNGLLAGRLVSLVLIIAGTATVVRSFRIA